MSNGARNRSSVTSTSMSVVGATAASASSRSRSVSAHDPAAFFDEPPARDVAQEPDASQCALLVGEPGGLRGDAGVGKLLLATDEQPGPGRHECLTGSGTAEDRRGGVVTADEVDGNPPPRAHLGSRREDGGQARAGESDRSAQLRGPVAGRQVEEPGGAGARALRHDLTGQVRDDEFGEHDDVRGARELLRVVRGQLEDRVDRQELHARQLVEPTLADPLDDAAVAARPRVAVRDRRLQELTVLVEQPVVDAPRVDPDRRDRADGERAVEPDVELRQQAVPLPTEHTSVVRARRVRHAVDDVDVRWAVTELDAAHPHRGRAEVDGGDGDAQRRAITDRSRRSPRRATRRAAAR